MPTQGASSALRIPGCLPLLLVLGMSLLLQACSREPILIGFAGPLSGVYSDLGVQGRNGAILAVEEINRHGGVAGRNLKILPRDDLNDRERTRNVDRQLINQGVVAIIGHMTSTQSKAALPVAQEAQIPLVSPTASSPELSGKKDMFFRVHAGSKRMAEALARFARERLGLVRMNAVLDTDNEAYTRPFVRDFSRRFEKRRGVISKKCAFSSSSPNNWAEVFRCLKQGNPQGVMIAASARDTAALCGIMAEKQVRRFVLCSGWAGTDALILQGGKAVEGLYLARSGYAARQSKAYRDFRSRFQKRFGRDPGFPALHSYLATKLLARALKRTGGEREGLSKALTRIEGIPSFNMPLKLNRFGDARMPISILRVKNGTFSPMAPSRPGK